MCASSLRMRPPGAGAKDGEGRKAMLWRWLPLGLSLGWPEKLREMNCYWPHRRVTGARNIYMWTLGHIGAGKPYESYILRTARWHKCGCIFFWGGRMSFEVFSATVSKKPRGRKREAGRADWRSTIKIHWGKTGRSLH